MHPPIANLDDAISRNRARGHHWFDPDTRRFFRSRVGAWQPATDGSLLFVSSEAPPSGDRRYTLRRVARDGAVSTVGEFLAYPTRVAALRALRAHLATITTATTPAQED